ncbi:phosphotransferase [Ferrovibrio terrae]|nr:phosphotransferase [Ferrovibrio terrae]
MAGALLKYFAIEDLNRSISAVEQELLGQAGQSTYVETEKLRLVRRDRLASSARRSTLALLRRGRFVQAVKTQLRQLIRLQAKSYDISASAEAITIRNNVSLFYVDRGIRAKLLMEQGVRNLEGLRNEYSTRRRLEALGVDFVPPLLCANLDRPPYYLADRLIEGIGLAWGDERTPAIMHNTLSKLWGLYRVIGLTWKTPAELGIDLPAISAMLTGAGIHQAAILLALSDKLLPVSLVHGDFSIGNIIICDGNNYIVDWELSHLGPVCVDFFKVLLRCPDLLAGIEDIMRPDIEALSAQQRDRVMSLSEQLALEFLLRLQRSQIDWAERPSILGW